MDVREAIWGPKEGARPPAVAAGQIQRQGFDGTETQSLAETSSAALAARQEAQVKARYVMAIRRPRNLDQVRDRMLEEAKRPAFASRAIFKVERGGEDIRGPSIRMAEALVQAMGNIHSQVSVIYDDADKVILNIVVTDLETNAIFEDEQVILKRVERRFVEAGRRIFGERITSKKKKTFIVEATEDDLFNKVNAWKSKAIRTAALRLVPRQLVDDILAKCRETTLEEDTKQLPQARAKMVAWFTEAGISEEILGQYLGYSPTQATAQDLGRLRELATAIREQEVTFDEALAEARAKRTPAKSEEPPPPAALKAEASPAAGSSPQSASSAKVASTSSTATGPQAGNQDPAAQPNPETVREPTGTEPREE